MGYRRIFIGVMMLFIANSIESSDVKNGVGVNQIVPGTNVTITPTSGRGQVTINSKTDLPLPEGATNYLIYVGSGTQYNLDKSSAAFSSATLNYLTINGYETISGGSMSISGANSALSVVRDNGKGVYLNKDGDVTILRASNAAIYFISDSAENGDASVRTNANNGLEFLTGGNSLMGTRMTILTGGNIGIGTQNPSSLLEVKGGSGTFATGVRLAGGKLTFPDDTTQDTAGVTLSTFQSVANSIASSTATLFTALTATATFARVQSVSIAASTANIFSALTTTATFAATVQSQLNSTAATMTQQFSFAFSSITTLQTATGTIVLRITNLDSSTSTLTTAINSTAATVTQQFSFAFSSISALSASTSSILSILKSTSALMTTQFSSAFSSLTTLQTATGTIVDRLNNLDSSTSTLTTAINSTAATMTQNFIFAFSSITSLQSVSNSIASSTNTILTGGVTSYLLFRATGTPYNLQFSTLTISSATALSGIRIASGNLTFPDNTTQITAGLTAGATTVWTSSQTFQRNVIVSSGPLYIKGGSAGASPGFNNTDMLIIENSQNTNIQLFGPLNKTSSLSFSNQIGKGQGAIKYDNAADSLSFFSSGTSNMFMDGTGNVGINNSAPSSLFDIKNGSLTIRGTNSGISIDNYSIFGSSWSSSNGVQFTSGTVAANSTITITKAQMGFSSIIMPLCVEAFELNNTAGTSVRSKNTLGTNSFQVYNADVVNGKNFVCAVFGVR